MPNLITGTAAAELLDGTAQDDSIEGAGGNDTLQGGAGADTLRGGAGIDSMTGGNGDDFYYVQDAGDIVVESNSSAASGGVDTVYSFLAGYTLGANVENLRIMSTGDANAKGNALANLFHAGDGDNLINGGLGRDTVSYQYADAAVSVNLARTGFQATGGSGSDRLVAIEDLVGSGFDDALTGNAQDNLLNGGAGNDTLRGSDGADTLRGGDGDDLMVGGDGDDTYYVDSSLDQVKETNGDAYDGGHDLVVSAVSWTLGANVENLRVSAGGAVDGTGNALDNTIYAGAGDNALTGAGGEDTVSYRYASSGVTVNLALAAAQDTGGSGIDMLKGFENLSGSAHDDWLRGNAGNNVIDGGAGVDTMTGGLGNDSYYVDEAADRVVESGSDWDEIHVDALAYTIPDLVEEAIITASGAADLTGNDEGNYIYPGDGDNVMDGAGGENTLNYTYAKAGVTVSLAESGPQATGGSGTDTVLNFTNLYGSYYSDELTGNAEDNDLSGVYGTDTLTGGEGNDRYYINAGCTVVENADEGTDSVNVIGPEYTLPANVENGYVHSTSPQKITGNGLDNVLGGYIGSDTLLGGAGNDSVNGGAGSDLLTGGGGNDTFRFTTAVQNVTNVDTLTDFTPGADVIALENGVFTALGAGALSADSFVTGTSAADANDYLVYDQATGSLYYDPDGNGATAKVLFAVLEGGPALGASDFLVT